MIMLVKEILKVKSTFNFSFVVDTPTGTETIQNDTIRSLMRQLYGKQAFCYENDNEDETGNDVATAFCAIWNTFILTEQENFNRIYKTLVTDYNPLENYDKTEHETNKTEHKNDVLTMLKGTTITTTYGQYEENTAVSTYEASEKDERTTTKGHKPNSSDIEGVTGTNTDTQVYGDIDTTRHNETHGNIGVRSSQELALQELGLRQYNFTLEVVKKFIGLYCFSYWGC